MSKNKGKIISAVDIGSSSVQMHIAQWDGQRIVTLDQLEKPTHVGQEVFSTGHISFETVRSLSDILTGFCALSKEYDIARPIVMATTALREATNLAYVLDHFAVTNHVNVQVLEDGEASALLFEALKSRYPSAEKVLQVYGGTGTIDFALLQNGKVLFTQSIQTGMLKIAEVMRETSEFSRYSDLVVKEHLTKFLSHAGQIYKMLETDGIVYASADIAPLLKILNGFEINTGTDTLVVSKEEMQKIYGEYKRLTVDQIARRHKLDLAQSGNIYVTIVFLMLLLDSTGVNHLYCTQINLVNAALNLNLRQGARRAFNENMREGTVSSALKMAEHYRCDLKHAGHVAYLALILFDKLKKLHGLSRQQRLLLETACILHEAGSFTNTADMREASFDLIKNAQIYGLQSRMTLLIANIVAPQDILGIAQSDRRGGVLNQEDMIFVNKMHSILHLADAIDESHLGKARLLDVKQDGDQLLLTLRVTEDYALERYALIQSAALFQEVFGLKLDYIVKKAGRMEDK
ncbi:MAG: hypothetical protein FWG94_03420 [Oscillospiraceae bacterium]|nr:hypothetical protein [Oscillospiraceae bacterium]